VSSSRLICTIDPGPSYNDGMTGGIAIGRGIWVGTSGRFVLDAKDGATSAGRDVAVVVNLRIIGEAAVGVRGGEILPWTD